MIKTKNIVRIWKRPARDGSSFTYYLRYKDLDGNFHVPSLGHNDSRKAEKQRLQKEKELRMGFCSPGSMRLSEFVEDCIRRVGDHFRESTKTDYRIAMKHLIKTIGDIDFQSVSHRQGEQFRQAYLDSGNSPHTVAKKIRCLKTIFQLAVKRKQLEENPFKDLKPPKTPKNKKIHTYTDEECQNLIKAASEYKNEHGLDWGILIMVALTTAMRKSELLNLTWADINFKQMEVTVSAKEDTETTWAWLIKDTDSRTLPLTEDVVNLLLKIKEQRSEGYPYVFISPERYDRIQATRRGTSSRKKTAWTLQDANLSVINGFIDMFNEIKAKAGVKNGTFHDIRRTAITNWFYAGLEVLEVMELAGHSKYETTLKHYLAVKNDLVDRARKAVKFQVN